jgi:hypothetical protein
MKHMRVLMVEGWLATTIQQQQKDGYGNSIRRRSEWMVSKNADANVSSPYTRHDETSETKKKISHPLK